MPQGSTNVLKRLHSIDVTPRFAAFSKVVIKVTEDLVYESGTNTGRTLEISCPWGTQQIADDILNKIRGMEYQPYTATGALIDPAAQLGDAVTAAGVYGGIWHHETTIGPIYRADLSAPQDEEIDHEYPYQQTTDREVIRNFAMTKAQFAVQANEIAARVTREGGDISSFGWRLTEDGFVLSSAYQDVFKCDENGVEVTGKITATSGFIGNGTSGFTITSNAIYNGVNSYNDNQHYGVYVGTDGIVLGKGAFKVDSAGNLTATSGTFSGYVRAGSILYGGNNGTFNGAGLTSGTVSGGYGGSIGGGTITTANTNGGINTSLGYADFSNGVFAGFNEAVYVKAIQGVFRYLTMGGHNYGPTYARVMGPDGSTPITIYYLGQSM